MSWKPSKRQSQLKQRLISSSRIYWKTSRTLDQMLLKILHNNNVYTPDDFYNKYIRSNQTKGANQATLNIPVRHYNSNDNQVRQSINRTLIDLDQVLHQLKKIINDKH